MKKERIIYIKDLLLYVVRKWKSMVVWMVVFAIFANGFSAIKSYKNVISSQQQSLSQREVTSEVADLNAVDKKKVEEIYRIYSAYRNSLDYSIDYYEHSIKMKINPTNVPTTYIQYQIEDSDKVADIITAYSKSILSESSLEKIKDRINTTENLSYIDELIEFNPDESKQIDDQKINEKKVGSFTMLIRIIALDQDMCETIADIVEDEIELNTQKIKRKIGDFNLNQIDRNYSNGVNQKLLKEQQDYMEKLDSIRTMIDSLGNSLTSDQQKYYNSLISQNESGNEINENEISAEVQLINVDYIVAGALIGVVLAVVWYVLMYILNNSLKVGQELEDYYGIQVLDSFQTINNSEKHRKTTNHFCDLSDNKCESEKLQLVYTNIRAIMEKENMRHIHITSVSDSEEIKTMKEKIFNELKKDCLNITKGGSVFEELDSLKNLIDADGVIMLEQVGKSDFGNIGKEIKLCLTNDVAIIGAIVIE